MGYNSRILDLEQESKRFMQRKPRESISTITKRIGLSNCIIRPVIKHKTLPEPDANTQPTENCEKIRFQK